MAILSNLPELEYSTLLPVFKKEFDHFFPMWFQRQNGSVTKEPPILACDLETRKRHFGATFLHISIICKGLSLLHFMVGRPSHMEAIFLLCTLQLKNKEMYSVFWLYRSGFMFQLLVVMRGSTADTTLFRCES